MMISDVGGAVSFCSKPYNQWLCRILVVACPKNTRFLILVNSKIPILLPCPETEESFVFSAKRCPGEARLARISHMPMDEI
jgi:hypothetical protein